MEVLFAETGRLGRTDESPIQNAEFESSLASLLATEACKFNLFSYLKINVKLMDLNVILEKARDIK